VATPGRAASSISLFALLSTVIFIVAVALSGGVFFYKGILAKQITDDKATLDRARAAFEPQLVDQIIRLDSRIETSKTLLKNHVAVTPFFDLLSSITLRSVRFKDFSFNFLAPDKIQVAMKGQAQSYAAVALQSDVFSAQKAISNTLLSDLSLDQTGAVTFNVSTSVDPNIVSYKNSVSGQAASSTNPQ
jgi:hypothetical protein